MDIVNKTSLDKLISSNKLVLADFFADWCGPCQMLIPILEDLHKEHSETIAIVKVDVDQSQDLATEDQVSSIPTLVFFKDGKVQETLTGFQSKDALAQKIKDLS